MAYCSNCGKEISDNAKFCKHCGQKVEDKLDDYEYFNEDFYCEKCGSNLSKQKGWHEEWDWFECYECGKIYYNTEFFCTKCNAVLNEQETFNPNNDFHKCEKCGEMIYADDVYSGERFPNTYWHCDKCNDLLSAQPGFTDFNDKWKCKKCGFVNRIGHEEEKKEEKKKTRETVYEGEIHKCPSCGEILGSFVSKCPSCGYEIRGVKTSNSVEQFSKLIINCNNEKELIKIISTFAVPNTKEDLFEFLLLAKTNILRDDRDDDGFLDKEERMVSNAWKMKLDQCYEKSKLILSEKDLKHFEKTYEEINRLKEKRTDLEREKNKEIKSNEIREEFKKKKGSKISIIVGIILAILFIALGFSNGKIVAGLFAILILACFIVALLIGNQTIKIRINKIYIPFIIIGYLLILPYIRLSNLDNSYNEKIEWESIVLSDKLPIIDDCEGKIWTNTDEKLDINDIKMTEAQFSNYVNKCKDFGYIIDSEYTSAHYEAYNSEGYKIYLLYIQSLDIEVNVPMKMNNISWPKSEIAELIPQPEELYGKISWENDNGFVIYIGNTSIEEYKKYVDEVMDAGFDIDYSRGDKYFYADNLNGYHVNVSYEGFNIIFIRIDAPNK